MLPTGVLSAEPGFVCGSPAGHLLVGICSSFFLLFFSHESPVERSRERTETCVQNRALREVGVRVSLVRVEDQGWRGLGLFSIPKEVAYSLFGHILAQIRRDHPGTFAWAKSLSLLNRGFGEYPWRFGHRSIRGLAGCDTSWRSRDPKGFGQNKVVSEVQWHWPPKMF